MVIEKAIYRDEMPVGYVVKDGTLVLPMCIKSLYTPLYIQPLIDAGYKYLGYDGDILTPDGTKISELPRLDFNDVDETEWFSSVDLANTDALSDADASKYYTFVNKNTITFRAPETIEINTREELIRYLDSANSLIESSGYYLDNRPINSFTNPDALFTLDELIEDTSLMRYIDIMVKRHRFASYNKYAELCRWFNEIGLLKNTNPSIEDFLSAYYAWGPEGITGKCISAKLDPAVDGNFQYSGASLGETSTLTYVTSNRAKHPGVIDTQHRLHFNKYDVDISRAAEVVEFGRSRLIPMSDSAIMQLRKLNFAGKRYNPCWVMCSDVSDRLSFVLMADNGFPYTYKVAHNKIMIKRAQGSQVQYYNDGNFMMSSIIKSIMIPLDYAQTKDEYNLWGAAIVKAGIAIDSVTEEPAYESSNDMLLKEGLSPKSYIDYIAHNMVSNKHLMTNNKYKLENPNDDLKNAFYFYLDDVPASVLQAFMLKESDLEFGILSFIELADPDDLRDRRDMMDEGQIKESDPGFDPTWKGKTAKWPETTETKDALDYYTKVKFVHDCLESNVYINYFGEGKRLDIGNTYLKVAECFMSLLYAENPNITFDEGIRILDNIGDYVNYSNIIRRRDNAAKGCTYDLSVLREARASDRTYSWCYCTKVFREASNRPVNEQRPYMMEIVTLTNDQKSGDAIFRTLATEIVRQSIEKMDLSDEPLVDDDEGFIPGNKSYKECVLDSSWWIGAKLFFMILAGAIKDVDESQEKFNITIDSIDIEVPMEAYKVIKSFDIASHKKYITLYDWCTTEYSVYSVNQAGTFNTCLINAIVDPWHVRPRKGFSIKTYSLLPNFYPESALTKVTSGSFYPDAVSRKEICVQPIRDTYKNMYLIDYDPVVMAQDIKQISETKTSEDLEYYLDDQVDEYVTAYVRRWGLARKEAEAQGKYLLSIPLKQDILFHNIAPYFCDEVPSTEKVMSNIPIPNISVSDTTVTKLRFDDNTVDSIADKHNRNIRKLSPIDVTIDEYKDIINFIDKGEQNVVIIGSYLVLDDGSKLNLASSSNATLESIGDAILKIGENKYIINTMNGIFVIGGNND